MITTIFRKNNSFLADFDVDTLTIGIERGVDLNYEFKYGKFQLIWKMKDGF